MPRLLYTKSDAPEADLESQKATMSIHRPTVLILASDPGFSREITENWPQDPAPRSDGPEFIVLDEGFSRRLEGSHYDLAIADASSEEILIHSDPSRDFYNIHGAVLELRRESGVWPAMAGLAGREILRRCQAESRAREAETICAAAQAEATLGRFMVEMRTNVNNALTTVLGNAELLVLEPGLPATVLAQADTIRNMALRLHEVFQRFSSIEKELHAEARESGKRAISAAAGR